MVTMAVIAVAWAIGSVLAMTSGTLLSWPDYVHVNFGLPFTFATHTLSTIAGPADKWDVDLGALAVDLAFWLSGLVLMSLLALGWLSRARS